MPPGAPVAACAARAGGTRSPSPGAVGLPPVGRGEGRLAGGSRELPRRVGRSRRGSPHGVVGRPGPTPAGPPRRRRHPRRAGPPAPATGDSPDAGAWARPAGGRSEPDRDPGVRRQLAACPGREAAAGPGELRPAARPEDAGERPRRYRRAVGPTAQPERRPAAWSGRTGPHCGGSTPGQAMRASAPGHRQRRALGAPAPARARVRHRRARTGRTAPRRQYGLDRTGDRDGAGEQPRRPAPDGARSPPRGTPGTPMPGPGGPSRAAAAVRTGPDRGPRRCGRTTETPGTGRRPEPTARHARDSDAGSGRPEPRHGGSTDWTRPGTATVRANNRDARHRTAPGAHRPARPGVRCRVRAARAAPRRQY
ncbi:hypothetical protein HGI09_06040 [Streptomyces collinus]|nr:hypothetical protein HGI10_58060 [Streptomyces collinus]UJA13309.1 hypothetical protein HGI09_06040 [Streptomyces collinus]